MSLMGASRTLAGLLLVQVGRHAGVMVCYAADVAGRAAVLECGGGRECRHRKGSNGVMRAGLATDRDGDGQRKRARWLRQFLLPTQCRWLLPHGKESEATRPVVQEERRPRGRSGGLCRRSCVVSVLVPMPTLHWWWWSGGCCC